jgi:hypothetical protein
MRYADSFFHINAHPIYYDNPIVVVMRFPIDPIQGLVTTNALGGPAEIRLKCDNGIINDSE